MNTDKPFCTVPFVEGFSGMDSAFRNCCAADPQIPSLPGQTFTAWWKDPRRLEFLQGQWSGNWPKECYRCRIQEENGGSSFRTAVNSQTIMDDNFGVWPSRWNLKFGNTCNLACWTCSEHSSSVIAQHKKTINVLSSNFVDPDEKFKKLWKTLENDILKSYDHHKIITLTLLGGEPLYNKIVIDFLNRLIDLGLDKRTRLEFHTNGTKINHKLFTNSNSWSYICVFLSFDAVGRKAEWLRYGTKWSAVESNIEFFKQVADYIEVHCTLSILNINDLPALDNFCKSQNLPLKIMTLSDPKYMSLEKWPGDKQLVINNDNRDNQFNSYYDLIGTDPDNTAIIKLRNYINQFNTIRNNLRLYDKHLADVIGIE